MESIYEPERFKASDIVNLKKHFTEFTNAIKKDPFPYSMSDKKKKEVIDEDPDVMEISLAFDQIKELENSCNLDNLLCEGELKMNKIEPSHHLLRSIVTENLPFVQKYSELEVVKTKNEIEKYRSCEKLLAMNRENFHRCIIEKDAEKDWIEDLTTGSDFVMNIVFYKPFQYSHHSVNAGWKCRFNHEIQMLGNNTLAQLRDKIICAADCGLQKEVDGPTADVSHLLNAKEEYPSGCFFVDGVFYNDLRSPKAVKYSKEFIKWGKKYEIGNFLEADMNTAKLIDLTLRFGYPYVYIHQGDCEHIMVFSDAHILTKNDCLSSQMYPRLYALNKMASVICYMCNISSSKWLIKDYDRLPQSNSYLCASCAKNYCSKDGKKIGDYKIYPVFNIS